MIKKIILIILIVVIAIFLFFFVGKGKERKDAVFGVTFSIRHSKNLGLDYKKVYLSILDDLKVRNLRIVVPWDEIEEKEGKYSFGILDWEINEAENRGVKVTLAIGMKVPRWPECFIPSFALTKTKEEQQRMILNLIREIVLRYKENKTVSSFQIENEPFFSFGNCPWYDKNFLKNEVKLAKRLDISKRKVIITDSGEWSLWFRAARIGDIVGTSLYRETYMDKIGYYFYSYFPPVFYRRKAQLINLLFRKEVIVSELQAEPWGNSLLYDLPLEKQKELMNKDIFRKNIEFARMTGLKEFYLWGVEWWYKMKEDQKDSSMWNEAKTLWQ